VTLILILVLPLVLLLFVLIFRMNHAEHFAPQAYYRRKTAGAPIAVGIESLGAARTQNVFRWACGRGIAPGSAESVPRKRPARG
jgi:hypothetical protein